MLKTPAVVIALTTASLTFVALGATIDHRFYLLGLGVTITNLAIASRIIQTL